MSIVHWHKIITEAQGRLAVVGDALGVLHDAMKLRAKDAVLNELMGDIAFILARQASHYRARTCGRRETRSAMR